MRLAPNKLPPTRTLDPIHLVAGLGAMLLMTGCTSIQKPTSGWFGSATPTPAPAPVSAGPTAATQVYYAASAGLEVFSKPASSSKVVGRLYPYQRVTRSKIENGYAYVEADETAVKGWVDNAKLLWRIPAPTANTPPAATPAPATNQH